ncbi:MAG: cytochrome c3 family protein [Desulfosarcina sp.]|jgi:hypothetical protein
MMPGCRWRLVIPALLLCLFVPGGVALADDMPFTFTYQFPDADPIKIYAGAVTFAHGKHINDYNISCDRCHHDIEPSNTEVDTNCRDCHTEAGFPRFEAAADLSEEEKIEHYLVALHTQCIDCHIDTKLKARQTRPPISCTRCHLAEKP